jgi:hypothetical protein
MWMGKLRISSKFRPGKNLFRPQQNTVFLNYSEDCRFLMILLFVNWSFYCHSGVCVDYLFWLKHASHQFHEKVLPNHRFETLFNLWVDRRFLSTFGFQDCHICSIRSTDLKIGFVEIELPDWVETIGLQALQSDKFRMMKMGEKSRRRKIERLFRTKTFKFFLFAPESHLLTASQWLDVQLFQCRD